MKFEDIDQGDFTEIEVEPGHQYVIMVVRKDEDEKPSWHVIERWVPSDA